MNEHAEQIAEALAAGRRRAAQNRVDAYVLEVLANATTDRREARLFRSEAREARRQADTLDEMTRR